MINDGKLAHRRMAIITQNFINDLRLLYNNDALIELIVDKGFMTREEFYEIENYDNFSYNKEEE